jgi:Vitamin K-dependent gamma-carboxylase
MDPSLEVALLWTQRLTGLAVCLQTLELLWLRRALADDGVWRWAILRQEHAALPAPLRGAFAVLLPYRPFVWLLVLRVPLGCLFAAGVGELGWVLLLTQLLVSARFRGTFNGGSDYMTMVLLLGSSLAALPGGGALAARAGLGYICAQLVLSYFIAGLVKLRNPAWRAGEALRTVLRSPRYAAPRWAKALAGRPTLALLASWLLMGFELGLPLSLASSSSATLAMALGLGFHVTNALVLGLNRFLFAWAAAYPALCYFAAALGAR